jgi:hypothetical protein
MRSLSTYFGGSTKVVPGVWGARNPRVPGREWGMMKLEGGIEGCRSKGGGTTRVHVQRETRSACSPVSSNHSPETVPGTTSQRGSCFMTHEVTFEATGGGSVHQSFASRRENQAGQNIVALVRV